MIAIPGIVYRVLLSTVFDNPSMQLLRFTPANLDFFAFGMLGAYLYVRRAEWLTRLSRPITQISLLALFLVFIHLYDLDFKPGLAYIFAPTFLGFITATLMLSWLLNPGTRLVRALSWTPIIFIAKISFSIYIWHTLVIEKLEPLAMGGVAKFFLSALITLVVSTITYYTIEAPFLKKKISV